MDGHTSSVILRGGSNYRPSGSMWYFPQTLRGNKSIPTALNEHEKYFLMDSRYERAGTIGFRCAADVVPAVPMAEQDDAATPCSHAPCGSFGAPAAFTTLTQTQTRDWATYGRAARMAKGSHELPANVSDLGGGTPAYCPQTVHSFTPSTSSGSFVQPDVVSSGAVSFSWSDASDASAANISTGLCSSAGASSVPPCLLVTLEGGEGDPL